MSESQTDSAELAYRYEVVVKGAAAININCSDHSQAVSTDHTTNPTGDDHQRPKYICCTGPLCNFRHLSSSNFDKESNICNACIIEKMRRKEIRAMKKKGATHSPPAQPTSQPGVVPSAQPSAYPSLQPSSISSAEPTSVPTAQPSAVPSSQPSASPSSQPSAVPSTEPTDHTGATNPSGDEQQLPAYICCTRCSNFLPSSAFTAGSKRCKRCRGIEKIVRKELSDGTPKPENILDEDALIKYFSDQVDKLLNANGPIENCQTCGVGVRNTALCMDHTHGTFTLRGLLCHSCNRCLTVKRDNPVQLMKFVNYVFDHSTLSEGEHKELLRELSILFAKLGR